MNLNKLNFIKKFELICSIDIYTLVIALWAYRISNLFAFSSSNMGVVMFHLHYSHSNIVYLDSIKYLFLYYVESMIDVEMSNYPLIN